MKFTVKGINFSKEELKTVPIEHFKVGSICHGHIFIFIGEKPFLMLMAGDYIDGSFLQKYMEKGVKSFWFLEITDPDRIQEFQSIFSSLKNSHTKPLQKQVSESFFKLFVKDFIIEKNISFLNLVIACHNSFYRFDHGIALKLHHASTILFSRSLICSTHMVLACLANGFYDFKFVQDLYNLAFIFDIGLADGTFTYAIQKACESERERPGSGLEVISRYTKNDSEKNTFINHPTASMHFAEGMTDLFHYAELIDILKYHHEKRDGTGFPSGLFYSSLSSWDCLLSYVDSIVDFKIWTFQNNDGAEFFSAIIKNLSQLKKYENLLLWEIANNVASVLSWGKISNEEVDPKEDEVEGAA